MTPHTVSSRRTSSPRLIRTSTEPILKPTLRDVCCVCFFTHAQLKRSGNKYHQWCYDMHIMEHHAAPQYIMPRNRGKE